MGDVIPDMIPGEPKWWGDMRAAFVILGVLTAMVAAASCFVWLMAGR
ncbi:MAG TPA: hypothetical protein VJT33_16905 [bacterium]|nr:hypothetical protein [bacterium]